MEHAMHAPIRAGGVEEMEDASCAETDLFLMEGCVFIKTGTQRLHCRTLQSSAEMGLEQMGMGVLRVEMVRVLCATRTRSVMSALLE